MASPSITWRNVTSPAPTLSNFSRALAITLRFEGGKVDDPADPGGRTAYGITQRVFWADCDAREVPRRDVFTITMAEVSTIYLRRYWRASASDFQPWAMCLLVFDAAVNHGVGRAVDFLRQASTPERYLDCRVAFYHAIVRRRPASQKFLKGWLRRADILRQIACPATSSLADLYQKAA